MLQNNKLAHAINGAGHRVHHQVDVRFHTTERTDKRARQRGRQIGSGHLPQSILCVRKISKTMGDKSME